MSSILLINPNATSFNPRIPNSILSIAASIEGKHDYIILDGNVDQDIFGSLENILKNNEIKLVGFTVMPGPQLKQAYPLSKRIKEFNKDIKIIWGGYFPSFQPKTVLKSGVVDIIVDGMGDSAFQLLVNTILKSDSDYFQIPNLILLKDGDLFKTKKDPIYDPENLPSFPYETLNKFYPLKKYLPKTYLGKHTVAYHSSFGCPFTCSFCGVVPIYNARWKGMSAQKIYKDIKLLKDNYGADSVEFHDNNFFVSEKRVIEFCELMMEENMIWWGEGRIDTIDKYKDETLVLMRRSGCKMIFYGAETGNDEVLKLMDKGGTQNGEQILSFAARMKKFDIIPEYCFVIGSPASTEKKVWEQLNFDIQFIKKVKTINPDTEVVMYMYTPVPTEGSEMYARAQELGFKYPQSLEEWLNPEWENFDKRRNPLTPWLTPAMVDKIRGFETVLNARYPTNSDVKLTKFQKNVISKFSLLRYKFDVFKFPYELKALQKFWLKYRRPETEGF